MWDTSPAVPRITVQQLSSASPPWRPAPSPQTNLHITVIRHLSTCCCLWKFIFFFKDQYSIKTKKVIEKKQQTTKNKSIENFLQKVIHHSSFLVYHFTHAVPESSNPFSIKLWTNKLILIIPSSAGLSPAGWGSVAASIKQKGKNKNRLTLKN